MVPEGYEKLATIGILYKGQYSSTAKYKFLSAVYYNGSTFVALKDNPVGVPTGDGINWQYMAKGFVEGVLSAVNAKDTSGVLGTVGKTVNSQTLVDAIADKVMTKLLQKNKVLQTVEQVMASKDAENVTGAAATAELNRKLTLKADLTANTFTDTQASSKNVHIDNNSFYNAHFKAVAPTNTDNDSRAGYGFLNAGWVGGFLYLDNDGSLKFADSVNNVYRIDMSKIK